MATTFAATVATFVPVEQHYLLQALFVYDP